MGGAISRVTAAEREHARRIAERPLTVTIERTTTTRVRGEAVPTKVNVGPVTIGLFFARPTPTSIQPSGTPGPVEKTYAYGALLPIFLDDGETPLYPNPSSLPNDPNVRECFVDPELGKLYLEHVYAVRVGAILIGWQADLGEEK
jgi:hypothetical protein